jgi:DNA-binding response OmpR family regulator
MPKIYECALEVRGYELDSFGHVNHAVYISYLRRKIDTEGLPPLIHTVRGMGYVLEVREA